jgi:hypothetical protein
MEPIPLMEGEGRSFRVLGFNQNQRAAFVQILMRLIPTLRKEEFCSWGYEIFKMHLHWLFHINFILQVWGRRL